MKKIMFNDRYGLTRAVLEGRKTMTRRIVPEGTPFGNWEETLKKSRYQVGEVVAVAQALKDVLPKYSSSVSPLKPEYTNKMFVRAAAMPHQIRITNIHIERLQDISDEDCMKEGIMEGEFMNTWDTFYYDEWGDVPNHITFKSPLKVFATLIDKVSGKGIWASNPWVFVYTFELIK